MGSFWESVKLLAVGAIFTAIQVVVIDTLVKRHFDQALEDYKFQLKTKEQAALIAEYAALAFRLKETDTEDTYRRANQLSWQLFLWLPDDIYRKLGIGLVISKDRKEIGDALLEVRRLLLKEKAGILNADDIIVHAPGISKATQQQLPQLKQ